MGNECGEPFPCQVPRSLSSVFSFPFYHSKGHFIAHESTYLNSFFTPSEFHGYNKVQLFSLLVFLAHPLLVPLKTSSKQFISYLCYLHVSVCDPLSLIRVACMSMRGGYFLEHVTLNPQPPGTINCQESLRGTQDLGRLFSL